MKKFAASLYTFIGSSSLIFIGMLDLKGWNILIIILFAILALIFNIIPVMEYFSDKLNPDNNEDNNQYLK